MEKTNLWPCPLDEKNLCTDWIDESFEAGGWMPTPECKGAVNSYLTFVEGEIVKVCWEFGDNQLHFRVIHSTVANDEYFAKVDAKVISKIKEIIADVESTTNSYNGDNRIKVMYNEGKQEIDFFFYWE